MTTPTDFDKSSMQTPVLTDAEARTIRLFVNSLRDNGAEAALALEIVRTAPTGISSAVVTLRMAAVDKALEDLVGSFDPKDPSSIFEAAPALKVVMTYMRGQQPILPLPRDFMPDHTLVQKCLDGFFALVRAEVMNGDS